MKQQLRDLIPGIEVWLDVDDLEDISALEQYVDASLCIVIFVSDGYFTSKNCMRELAQCVAKRKPLITVIEADPAKGGLSLAQAKQQLHEGDALRRGWGLPLTPSSRCINHGRYA